MSEQKDEEPQIHDDLLTRRARLKKCIVLALRPALKTGVWLLALTVPVSFLVLVLKVSGVLGVLAGFFEPVFSLFGLPGESAFVFVTACLLNVYSSIAVIETLGLSGNVVTILALMCLISHSLPVESVVQQKTGSRLLPIVCVRICAAFAGATALSVLLPPDTADASVVAAGDVPLAANFSTEFPIWLGDISKLCVKIIVLLTLLMILQRILEEFGVTTFLSRLLRYPLMVLGVPHEAAFLWIVANTLGLSYGAGVIVDHVERGKLSQKNSNILNYHIAVSHSLLEDTCLFVAIGVSAWWITIPRVIIAGIVVWLKRLIDWVRGSSESSCL